ncbi:hypothetical protein Tco_0625929 [Tanacetum coccineum]|uniref:Uncharacterized protein n=1 Tax=Tanacetum coccineum TaxID=301880 RepID=A0ABQ4WIC6_9ASTR
MVVMKFMHMTKRVIGDKESVIIQRIDDFEVVKKGFKRARGTSENFVKAKGSTGRQRSLVHLKLVVTFEVLIEKKKCFSSLRLDEVFNWVDVVFDGAFVVNAFWRRDYGSLIFLGRVIEEEAYGGKFMWKKLFEEGMKDGARGSDAEAWGRVEGDRSMTEVVSRMRSRHNRRSRDTGSPRYRDGAGCAVACASLHSIGDGGAVSADATRCGGGQLWGGGRRG